jgi:two-component system nitrate/nitrite response regulator NarP
MSELFDRDPRFSLVATSATAEGFLGAVMRVPVTVAVIDWNLPALGGQKADRDPARSARRPADRGLWR